MAKRAWSDIITYERNRMQIVPKLEDTMLKYKQYEKDVLTDITKLRQAAQSLDKSNIDISKLAEFEKLASTLSPKISLQAENYPALSSSQLYIQFMQDWKDCQENVSAAISSYNQTVQQFNDKLMIFPSNIVNDIFLKRNKLEVFDDAEVSKDFLSYKPNFY